jgi:hypothetical protein
MNQKIPQKIQTSREKWKKKKKTPKINTEKISTSRTLRGK